MTHLGTLNTNYGQKKVRESNCQFDFRALKFGNCLDVLACKWGATYRWKALDKGYNFGLELISIENLHIKLWDSKITGVPILVSGQNDIWVLAP
jgi:hypothetical protein